MASPGDDEQTQQNTKEEKPDVQQLTIVVKAQVRSAFSVVTTLVCLTVICAPVRRDMRLSALACCHGLVTSLYSLARHQRRTT